MHTTYLNISWNFVFHVLYFFKLLCITNMKKLTRDGRSQRRCGTMG